MTDIKTILYAEDDENDVFLMERAFTKLSIPNPLRILGDGKLTIAYLAGKPPYESMPSAPSPAILLMDLSMPGKHGLEVLKWIRQESPVPKLPVIIFTSSSQDSDIQDAYKLGADGYIVKPGDSSQLIKIMKCIQDYWLVEDRPREEFVDFATSVVVPRPKAVSMN